MRRCEQCPVPDDLRCPAVYHSRFCELLASGRDDYRPVIEAMAQGMPAEPVSAPIPLGTALIRTFLNSWAGFGRFGEGLGIGLEAVGVPVLYEAITFDNRFLPVGEFQRDRAIAKASVDAWRLMIHFANHPIPVGPTIVYTMHESSGWPKGWIDNLNRARAVIFPCYWNLDCARVDGLTIPAFVVPGGVDTAVFRPGRDREADRPFVVVMAMRLAHGGCRKGWREGIAAFLLAFPFQRDVELRLKFYPDCQTGELPDDPRIVIDRTPMTPVQMADWYRRADVLLVPSKAEGFGLHSLEALACGVPILAALETGTKEFATEACCYPLEGRWEPAKIHYEAQGNWFVPSIGSMVEQLRRAYRDRDEVQRKGEAGIVQASRFTWVHAGAKLRKVLVSAGMLEPKKRVPLGEPHCLPCVSSQRASVF